MKNLTKILLLPVVLSTMVSCSSKADSTAPKPDEIQITDMLGRKVNVKKDANEFVCVGPGALRQYCYVADDRELVGIENYEKISDPATRPYINAVSHLDFLPVIGEGGPKDNTNLEALVALNPDVVFTSYTTDIAKVELMAEKTKLPIVAVGYNPNGLFAEDIYQSLKLIGKITHNEKRAEEVVNFFEDCKKELKAAADVKPTTKKAYVGAINRKGSHGMTYTTPNYLIFDVLNIENAAKSMNIETYADIDFEALREVDPDIIFVDAGGLANVKKDYAESPKVYNDLKAFKNKEVYVQMPFTFYSNNLEVALANAYFTAFTIYPEQFENKNIIEKFNAITQTLLGVTCYTPLANKFNCNYGSFFDNI